jgi:hypothetical protein
MSCTTDAPNTWYLLIINPLILKFRLYVIIQVTKQDEFFLQEFSNNAHYKKNYSKK